MLLWLPFWTAQFYNIYFVGNPENSQGEWVLVANQAFQKIKQQSLNLWFAEWFLSFLK